MRKAIGEMLGALLPVVAPVPTSIGVEMVVRGVDGHGTLRSALG